MLGEKNDRWQEDLFVAGPMSALIPDDHVLKRVDKILNFSWLREEVKDLYCENNGRPSIDPEVAVRLMLAGFFQGIVHDRKLMREARVNLAIRWFAGYKLHETLPDHSSLTRIRQRWGAERFKRIFQRTVEACVHAGLVDGETVHVDATLIRADVSWDSLITTYAEDVVRENDDSTPTDHENKKKKRVGRLAKKPKPKKISRTDPDATMSTSSRDFHLQPTYKQHTAVDDKAGVVVDVDVTTGQVNEGKQLIEQIDRIEQTTGVEVKTLTADAGYAHSRNFATLEQREIKAVIPPQKQAGRAGTIPLRRFKYCGKHQAVRCPAGKFLKRGCRKEKQGGWLYRSSAKVCALCSKRKHCIPSSAKVRTILIVDGYEALLRARRFHARWGEREREEYQRHRWLVEGRHGEGKTQHGLSRAVRRGTENVAIQVYLTAAVMNLKRLAAFLRLFLTLLRHRTAWGRVPRSCAAL
jgi:transposase